MFSIASLPALTAVALFAILVCTRTVDMRDELSERLRDIQLGQEVRGIFPDLPVVGEIANMKANEQLVTGPARGGASLKLVTARELLELGFQRGGG